jgi:hypothetical protein
MQQNKGVTTSCSTPLCSQIFTKFWHTDKTKNIKTQTLIRAVASTSRKQLKTCKKYAAAKPEWHYEENKR